MSQDTTIYLAIDVSKFQEGLFLSEGSCNSPFLFYQAPEPGALRFQRLFVSVTKHAISQNKESLQH